MFVLLIFNDQTNEKLNCIWLFDTFKQLSEKTHGIIHYQDTYKKNQKYKTRKSFFKVLNVNRKDNAKYFRK